MLKHTSAAIIAFAALVAVSPVSSFAQEGADRNCTTPDSIAVSGNKRVPSSTIILDAGLVAGVPMNAPSLRRSITAVFQSGQFETVDVSCQLLSAPARTVLIISVVERPLLDFVDVTGPKKVAITEVKDRVDMLNGRPVDPAQVARTVTRIDSLYFSKGYPLVHVKVDTTRSADNHAAIMFRVDEGHRLAISGINIEGNSKISSAEIASAMSTKREKFFFWQTGELDQEEYAKDIGERIPELYTSRGFIDFQLTQDTLIIDRARGKALISLKVSEGPQYHVGTFEVTGNKRFNSEDIARYYPFGTQTRSLTDRLKGIVVKGTPVGVFNQSAWDIATQKTHEAYANEGYIYADVKPVMDREPNDPTGPKVNLRWDIVERTPAIINRIDIVGNDFTVETCIRDQLSVIPGQVFNQDALIRSYQSIGNLGFFETPVPFPETRPSGDAGDVDVIFKVKEKRTGNINFGASMGQGTGLGGFIGLEQPNLFGKCKKGSLNWQYGRYINDFSLSYTDPALAQSQYSLTVTGYRSQSRYTIADLGQSTRTGGSVRIAFPFFKSHYTRVGVTYGAEEVRYGGDGLLGTITTNDCAGCLRSTLGFDLTRDTRAEMPFPTLGSLQTLNAQFNGGPLGGTASFQRYTTEFKTYTTLAAWGGGKPGQSAMKLVAGLSQRAGVVMGNPGPFFSSQAFALGGTQYGEQLRGYPEFSITPLGFDPNTSTSNATLNSFGNTFFAATAELGVRFSSSFYADLFYDAGNLWAHPRDFNPTRLFRGAGIGAAIISPLGPLGLDWAYGFDRVDQFGHPAPAWQVHFKLGQFFY